MIVKMYYTVTHHTGMPITGCIHDSINGGTHLNSLVLVAPSPEAVINPLLY